MLVLNDVYAYRIELVVGGMVRPLVQLPPGIAKGTYADGISSFVYTGSYHPSWVEISIVLAMIALLASLITIGYRRLKVMSGVTPDPDMTGPADPAVSRQPEVSS